MYSESKSRSEMRKTPKIKLLLLAFIVFNIFLSGCSAPSPNFPSLNDIAKKIPFISSGDEKSNTSKNNAQNIEENRVGDNINITTPKSKASSEDSKNLEEDTVQSDEGEENTVKFEPFSRLIVLPDYAELNRTTGKWNVILEVLFETNLPEEFGRWELTLLNESGGVLERRLVWTARAVNDSDSLDSSEIVERFSTKFSIKGINEGTKYKVVATGTRNVLQNGSVAAQYALKKEADVLIDSDVELLGIHYDCLEVEFDIRFTGLIPKKSFITVEFTGDVKKNFSKEVWLTGGEVYHVDFDSNLRGSIFNVRNGNSTIILNLEKFIRVGSTPNTEATISLENDNVIGSLKLGKLDFKVNISNGLRLIRNSTTTLPIYIDSVVFAGKETKIIPIGQILCRELTLTPTIPESKVIIIGGPNLYWDDGVKRYLTKKPDYILFEGYLNQK
jgi:hypothetical protein